MKLAPGLALAVLAAATAVAQSREPNAVMMPSADASGPIAASAQKDATGAKADEAAIREALALAIERAGKSLARVDGYFGNEEARIRMPASLRKVAEAAPAAGFDKQVDAFILAMNRAAEAAAPQAARLFAEAIRDVAVDDASRLVAQGGDAATDYFHHQVHDRLYAACKPIVARKIAEVGATRAYGAMMERYAKAAPADKPSVDLERYVTVKALEGLFARVGEEERTIRTDRSVRGSTLLESVFGR